mgnify:CR=1 FL=1
MILSNELLKEIKYYEVRKIRSVLGVKTRFILHNNKWWKKDIVINLDWDLEKINNDGMGNFYTESCDIVELNGQLTDYFKNLNKESHHDSK